MGFIKICTLASSSSGNCTLVSQGGTHVLIDAGISLRRITASLARFELTPKDLAGVVVTHEHSDHVKGIKMLVKYHNTPILAPDGVAGALHELLPEARQCISGFYAGAELSIGELYVRSFATMHDTPESVGYRFEDGRTSFVLATDIGCVSQPVLEAAQGADMAVIEANHDVEMLKNGKYPYFLKRRVLSDRGHLSNDDSGQFAVRLARSGTSKILLAHLSRDNNTPGKAFDTVGGALSGAGAAVGKDVLLKTAPPDDMSDVYIL